MAKTTPEIKKEESTDSGSEMDWTRFLMAVLVAAAFVAIIVIFF